MDRYRDVRIRKTKLVHKTPQILSNEVRATMKLPLCCILGIKDGDRCSCTYRICEEHIRVYSLRDSVFYDNDIHNYIADLHRRCDPNCFIVKDRAGNVARKKPNG